MPQAGQYPLSGSCNCGAVEYQVSQPFEIQAVCHCVQCQKHTQSAFSIVGITSSAAFSVTRGDLKLWSKTADSGNVVDCWFCPDCGNRIYHASRDNPDQIKLKLGTLDNTDVIDPKIHVWTSMKQNWFQIPDGVTTLEEQP